MKKKSTIPLTVTSSNNHVIQPYMFEPGTEEELLEYGCLQVATSKW